MRIHPAPHHWQSLASLAMLLLAGEAVWRPSALAQPITKDVMLKGIVGNVIAPGYRELAVKCQALTVAAEQLAKTPTGESLEQTRLAWLATLLSARQMQWLQTGPIADREYLATLYYAKVLPNRVADVLNSTRGFDEAYLAELGAATKGLFTLEYLLFDPRAEPAAKDPKGLAPVPQDFFGTNVQRRCQFLLALAEDVRRKADHLAGDWAGTNHQDVAAKFAAGGQETLNRLVNELAALLEKIVDNHLNFALQLPAPLARQLDRIEGARSRTTMAQLAAMLRGAETAYRGGEGTGIDDYLRKLNQPLESRVADQFQKARSALEAIDAPLEVALTDQKNSVQRAYQVVRELEILFKVDLASALGVTITINSNDGD